VKKYNPVKYTYWNKKTKKNVGRDKTAELLLLLWKIIAHICYNINRDIFSNQIKSLLNAWNLSFNQSLLKTFSNKKESEIFVKNQFGWALKYFMKKLLSKLFSVKNIFCKLQTNVKAKLVVFDLVCKCFKNSFSHQCLWLLISMVVCWQLTKNILLPMYV